MKRNNAFLEGLLLLSLTLVGCKSSNPKVSFFYFSDTDNFINSLSNELTLKFSSKYTVENFYAGNSQPTQNHQFVKEINKNNPNLLVVNIVDRLSASSFMELASKTKTPIIFVNREPLLEDVLNYQNIYYVGTDPVYEGKAQAEIADELFKTQPGGFNLSKFDKNKDGILQVYLIKGEQGHQDTEERSKHSLLRLNDLGYKVDLIHTSYCDWDREKAKTEFSKVYKDTLDEFGNSKIELLLSNNDDMALGCIDYLKELDNFDANEYIVEQFFPIIGVNGTKLGIEAVNRGEIFGTVKNNSSVQADAIYKLGTKLIKKESLDNFEYEFDDNGRFIHTSGKKIIMKAGIDR